jgi:hypothetical protein
MAKKKRTNNLQEQKQQKAHKKNEFMNKLLDVCRVIGDESLYYLMPEEFRLTIYRKRGLIKIKIEKGAKIQKRLIEVLEKTIRRQLIMTPIELVAGSGRTICLADYMRVAMSMEMALDKDHPDEQFAGKERFAGYLADAERRQEEYAVKVMQLCITVCNIFDDISQKRLYTINMNYDTNLDKVDIILNSRIKQNLRPQLLDELDFKLYHIITLGTYPLDTRQVTVKGETRPVIQLGTLHQPESAAPFTFIPFKIPGEKLNINSQFAKLKIPVYIQQHALNRIMERSGYSVPGICKLDLIMAIFAPVVIGIGKDSFLIEYRIAGLKIGYLVAKLIDGLLVIITFLLLTNNGTPEGDKLAKLTGLKKLDKEYLMIDNLCSLAHSDILESEIVCKLFRDAGCQSILDVCEKLKNNSDLLWMIGKGEQKNSMSELIIEYLKPDANNDEYVSE